MAPMAGNRQPIAGASGRGAQIQESVARSRPPGAGGGGKARGGGRERAACAAAAGPPGRPCARRARRGAAGAAVARDVLVAVWGCVLVHAVGGVGLEATLIAVDNSGYMINTDHRPSRMQSQYECVNLVCTVKTQNPENTVGLMTMGCLTDSECPRVHVTPATNQQIGPILISMSKINDRIGRAGRNSVRFEKAMRTAYLSLKHRVNKNQRPRIVAFVGSPLIGEDKSELVCVRVRERVPACLSACLSACVPMFVWERLLIRACTCVYARARAPVCACPQLWACARGCVRAAP